jgi:AraC family transcriptional regulator
LLALPEHWGGLPLGVFPIPAVEKRGPSHAAHPMLVMVLRGRGKRLYRHGSRTEEFTIAPQQMDLLGCGYERDVAHWDAQEGLTVGVQLRPDVVARLAHEPGFDVQTRHEVFDPQMSWLVQALHDEAQRGAPGGALFAQGLSIALIGWLREHYGRREAQRAYGAAGLTPLQQQRVRDCVEAHLGEDLSIVRLAQEAVLSPVHFARAFKASFGCTPHRWVQQRRIEAAVRLLRTTARPIVDIALDLGFASQSHFTQVLRQATGTTCCLPRFLTRSFSRSFVIQDGRLPALGHQVTQCGAVA